MDEGGVVPPCNGELFGEVGVVGAGTVPQSPPSSLSDTAARSPYSTLTNWTSVTGKRAAG